MGRQARKLSRARKKKRDPAQPTRMRAREWQGRRERRPIVARLASECARVPDRPVLAFAVRGVHAARRCRHGGIVPILLGLGAPVRGFGHPQDWLREVAHRLAVRSACANITATVERDRHSCGTGPVGEEQGRRVRGRAAIIFSRQIISRARLRDDDDADQRSEDVIRPRLFAR